MKIGDFIGFVYKTTNLINGKIYIGQHEFVSPNINDGYLGSGLRLENAIKKYGKINFKRVILKLCKTQMELDIWEHFYIIKFKSQNENIGYNIANGVFFRGNRNIAKNKEIREKISKKLKGRIISEETRMKMRKAKEGMYLGEDNPNYGKHTIAGKNHFYFGKHRTEETKKKISQRAKEDYRIGKRKSYFKGKHLSEETKEKLRRANSGVNSGCYGKFWITNGVISKYWNDENTIPEGWRKGRVLKKPN